MIPINGVKQWLWRAVDANGDTLDILVQGRRNTKAAKRFLTRPIAQFGLPRLVIFDKLCSYIKPIAHLAPDVDHRAHKGLNNRIDGSHRPTRRREKIMGRFKSARQAQRCLAAHDQINTIFKTRRYCLTASARVFEFFEPAVALLPNPAHGQSSVKNGYAVTGCRPKWGALPRRLP